MGWTSDGIAGCEEREKNVKEGKKNNFSVTLEGLGVNVVSTEGVSELHHVDLLSIHRS